jgi:uncharacterized membrane protein
MRYILPVLNGVLLVLYPVAVYFGLTHYGPRVVGLLLLVLLAPGLLAKLRNVSRADLLAVARLPLAVVGLLLLAAWFDDPRFVLALPVLINLTLLAGFGTSLRTTPMVERFARMQDPRLGPAQVRYCRTVTKVWCVFFAMNAALSAALGVFASVHAWALWTGLFAYVAIGVLGASEYVVRKYKFREYGNGLHDRLLAKVFPPQSRADSGVPAHGEMP